MPAQGEVGVDASLERGQPFLIEPGGDRGDKVIACEVGEHVAAPQSEGPGEQLRGVFVVVLRHSLAAGFGQLLELDRVDCTILAEQRIPVLLREQHLSGCAAFTAGFEYLAQVEYVRLQGG